MRWGEEQREQEDTEQEEEEEKEDEEEEKEEEEEEEEAPFTHMGNQGSVHGGRNGGETEGEVS